MISIISSEFLDDSNPAIRLFAGSRKAEDVPFFKPLLYQDEKRPGIGGHVLEGIAMMLGLGKKSILWDLVSGMEISNNHSSKTGDQEMWYCRLD